MKLLGFALLLLFSSPAEAHTVDRIDAKPSRPGDDLSITSLDLQHENVRNGTIALDAVSVGSVPLPTALSLFGTALLLLGAAGLRSSRRTVPFDDLGIDRQPSGTGPWSPCDTDKVFRIEASDQVGARTIVARSPREAMDRIADLLNENFKIDRLTNFRGVAVDYEDIIRAGNAHHQLDP